MKLEVTQIYTDRCLSYEKLNKYELALNDANYVLTNLDPKNY